MNMPKSRLAQRGVTLFVGLILMVLITLMVTTAFTLSTTNLRSVGNMQARDEAIAAANIAIEDLLGSSFTDAPAASSTTIDINNDLTTDYLVAIGTPVCIRASVNTTATLSSASLGSEMSSVSQWNTLWDITATATDAKSGAKTIVNVGTRVLLNQVKKDAVCP